MNKKVLLILITCSVILGIILLVALLYWHAAAQTRKDYITIFNNCKANEKSDELQSEAALACHDQGGCFIACGSACHHPKPTLELRELWDYYYPLPRACIALCVPQCIPPP